MDVLPTHQIEQHSEQKEKEFACMAWHPGQATTKLTENDVLLQGSMAETMNSTFLEIPANSVRGAWKLQA